MRAMLLVLAGCGAGDAGDSASSMSAPASASAVVGDRTASETTSERAGIPSATESAFPSAAPALSGLAGLQAKFPVANGPRTGPGVACGSATCTAGQVCCAGVEPSCVEAASAASCDALSCDESIDCAKNERCCMGRTGPDHIIAECVAERRCTALWDRPGGSGIPAREVCALGGKCSTSGQVCIASDDGAPSGECVSAVARADCGSVECGGDTPWCLWSPTTKQGLCVPRGPWHSSEGVFECDARADCPGGRCCAFAGGSSCCSDAQADPELGYGPVLCRTAADCVRSTLGQAHCEPMASPSGEMPASYRGCGYGKLP